MASEPESKLLPGSIRLVPFPARCPTNWPHEVVTPQYKPEKEWRKACHVYTSLHVKELNYTFCCNIGYLKVSQGRFSPVMRESNCESHSGAK